MTPEEFSRTYLPLADGLYQTAFDLLGSREEAEALTPVEKPAKKR